MEWQCSFFRGVDASGGLAELVIPKLFEGRGTYRTVRIRVSGRAAGEAVFSLAIPMLRRSSTRSS